jgi:predicted nucleic acid-binding Zn ribbon protein
MIPVQHVLPAMLGDLVRRQPLSPAKVDFAWRTSVGPAIAHVSKVRLAKDGTLYVVVDDRRWQKEITRSRDLIRARLDPLLGTDLQRIEVRTSAGGRAGEHEP